MEKEHWHKNYEGGILWKINYIILKAFTFELFSFYNMFVSVPESPSNSRILKEPVPSLNILT